MHRIKSTTAAQHTPTAETVCESVLGWLRSPASLMRLDETTSWGAVEWEAARWAIQVHGIAPLLYHHLRHHSGWATLAPTLQTYLETQYDLNQQRLRLLVAEQETLLQAAKQAGIPLMPLKGSVLIWRFYEEPALRPMADLDLLLHPNNEPAFATLLHTLGYHATNNTPRHRSYARAVYSPETLFTEGEHPDNPRGVEIHTEARESFWGIQYDVTSELWAGAALIPVGETEAWIPDDVALLQHLLIHASMDVIDGKSRLIRLYDIQLVGARLSEEQWARLLRAGQQRGEERLLYGALFLAERYLGRVAPPAIMAALAGGTPRRLQGFLEQSTLYHLSFCNPLALPIRERLCWHRSGWEQGAAIAHRIVPSPRTVRQLHPGLTPPYLLPVAYLAYFFNLLDGLARRLLHSPRRPWLHRGQGGARK